MSPSESRRNRPSTERTSPSWPIGVISTRSPGWIDNPTIAGLAAGTSRRIRRIVAAACSTTSVDALHRPVAGVEAPGRAPVAATIAGVAELDLAARARASSRASRRSRSASSQLVRGQLAQNRSASDLASRRRDCIASASSRRRRMSSSSASARTSAGSTRVRGRIQHRLRHAESPRDRQRVRAARHANHQPIGRRQRLTSNSTLAFSTPGVA